MPRAAGGPSRRERPGGAGSGDGRDTSVAVESGGCQRVPSRLLGSTGGVRNAFRSILCSSPGATGPSGACAVLPHYR